MRACNLFDFYAEGKAKCSTSNIEAFKSMVEKTYPDLYAELSDTGKKSISDIQEVTTARSNGLLSNGIIE